MAAAAAIGVGAGLSLLQSQGAVKAASYNQAVADANAEMMNQQADRTIKIADEQANDFRRNVKRTVGSQRAALAAQGVDVNDSSALDIQTETEVLGAQDALKISTNGYLEALGIRTQARNMQTQARYNTQAAQNAVVPSMLTAGLQGYMASGGFASKGPTPTSMRTGAATTSAGGSYTNFGSIA